MAGPIPTPRLPFIQQIQNNILFTSVFLLFLEPVCVQSNILIPPIYAFNDDRSCIIKHIQDVKLFVDAPKHSCGPYALKAFKLIGGTDDDVCIAA
ncbi:hypothetical protein BX070DRAFT_220793 [Coemansia spiralis]|nr:hypothetical protein BX070DRAFT_220793 [Coemansia spiralis]